MNRNAVMFLLSLVVWAAVAAAQQPGAGRSAGDFTPPVLITSVRPAYPSEAEAQRVTGTVEIQVAIDPTGAVQPRVIKPAHPLLDAAALAAVRQYRYLPATVGGRATTVSTSVELDFRLDDIAGPAPGVAEPPLDRARRLAVLGQVAELDQVLAGDASLVTRGVSYLNDPSTGSLLHMGTLYGQHHVLETVAALLAKGANVNGRDARGYTPLGLALIRKGREQLYFAQDAVSDEIAALLIARGANVRERWEGGFTPVLLAVATGASAKTVELLLDRGADIDVRTGGNANALMLAVSRTLDVDLIRLLLDRGAATDVRAAIDNGTALHRVFGAAATRDAITTVVGLLIDHGADVRARNQVGTTPLLIAAWQATPETIDRLVAAGANVNQPNLPPAGGTSPLHTAALNGKLDNVAALLRHGANIGARNANGLTPLEVAERAGQAAVVKLLQAALAGARP